ncbi:unnamed protein product [Durusdinium trenchii]|uniref:Uncharacterized protein n=2 Tax=Durusdinium trenchii TaxID=1381693 RepID=A0ABP0SDR7_9DINO
MAEGPDPRDAELRDLNRKFEELMRKVENKEQKDDGALPDWYRFPDPLIPSWLTHESPLQQPAQPDRLASVIASHEWPGRGGFNWSVCLPTNGKS